MGAQPAFLKSDNKESYPRARSVHKLSDHRRLKVIAGFIDAWNDDSINQVNGRRISENVEDMSYSHCQRIIRDMADEDIFKTERRGQSTVYTPATDEIEQHLQSITETSRFLDKFPEGMDHETENQ